jgi:predicted PurR-regulated permease PerM
MDRDFVKKTLFVFGVGLFLAFIWFAHKILVLLFCGFLIALLLTTLTGLLTRHLHFPQKLALLTVIVLLLGAFTLLGWFIAPAFVDQFTELGKRLPQIIQEQVHALQSRPWFQQISTNLPGANALTSTGTKVFSKVSSAFASIFDAAASFVFVIFVSLFLSANPQFYKKGALRLFSPHYRPKAEETLNKTICILRYWLLGQLIDMVAVGILVGIGVSLLGVPLPAALGVLAGLFEFIPFLGPLLSAVPACLLALSISPTKALATAGLFLGIQFAENHLLVPLVQQRTVDLPPVLTLVAILLFGSAFGVLGMLIATPSAAILYSLLQDSYQHRDGQETA